LAFSNNSSTQSLALDAAGAGSVTVTSLGHMNDQQTGSELGLLRVAIRTGTERKYISLLSAAQYTEIAGYYVTHLHPNPPVLAALNTGTNIAGSYLNPALDFFISLAHAAFFSLSDVGAWVQTGVSFLIPFEDIQLVFKQLQLLASSDPAFDPVELSLAALGTATIIPLAKPIIPVLKPLQKMIRFSNNANPKFVKSFAGVAGKAIKKAWDDKSFQILLDMLPFLVIAGELMADEESRQALLVIIESIQSDDDLWAWIEYLRLPADGWDGDETQMPDLDLSVASWDSNENLYNTSSFMLAGA